MRSDLLVGRIVAQFGGSILEIFLNNHIIASKIEQRKEIGKFVNTFVKHRTFKEVIQSVGD